MPSCCPPVLGPFSWAIVSLSLPIISHKCFTLRLYSYSNGKGDNAHCTKCTSSHCINWQRTQKKNADRQDKTKSTQNLWLLCVQMHFVVKCNESRAHWLVFPIYWAFTGAVHKVFAEPCSHFSASVYIQWSFTKWICTLIECLIACNSKVMAIIGNVMAMEWQWNDTGMAM